MTVTEIIAEVKRYLRDRTGRLMSDTEYLASVQSAYESMRQKALDLNEQAVATSCALTVPASTSTIALTALNASLAGVLRLIAIYNGDGMLVPFSYATEQEWFAGYQTFPISICPRALMIYGNNVKFLPTTDGALSWTCWYVSPTETLATGSVPALPAEYHRLIALRAALEIRKILGGDARDLFELTVEKEQAFESWLYSQRQGLPRELEHPFIDHTLG